MIAWRVKDLPYSLRSLFGEEDLGLLLVAKAIWNAAHFIGAEDQEQFTMASLKRRKLVPA